MNFKSCNIRAAFAVACALALGSLGEASTIAISDPSFETPVVSPGSFTGISGTGWTSTGGSPVIDYPLSNQFNSIPDGNQVAILNDFNGTGTLSQTLAAALAADMTYTLTFYVGNDKLLAYDGYDASLTAGGVTVASDTSAVSPTPGNFLQDTIVYNSGASPAQLGQTLGITFSDVGLDSVAFDLVQLDASPSTQNAAPEPRTWVLLAMALGALMVLRPATRRAVLR